jgi:hypothetical protein
LVSNITANDRHQIRANARAFLRRSTTPDLTAQLYEALVADAGLGNLAFLESAERFVTIQECWAKAIGSAFAEAVRAAFRDAERDMRQSMQEAQNAAWAAESEGEREIKLHAFKDALAQGRVPPSRLAALVRTNHGQNGGAK